MKIIFISLFLTVFSACLSGVRAQSVDPIAYSITDEGEEALENGYSGSAPLKVRFEPQVECPDNWTLVEGVWKFYRNTVSDATLNFVRNVDVNGDMNTEYTFTEAGNHKIAFMAVFVNSDDRSDSIFSSDWYENDDVQPFSITIKSSKLEMPNAFSPNDDGTNDYYQAKTTIESIVEFKATIYNRWGQKLYSWTDPYNKESGWDGKFNGTPVKQGVYFVNVHAKGADGYVYDIKRDVNLLRGYTESESGSDGGSK